MQIKIDISKVDTVKKAIEALRKAQKTLLDKVVGELAKECYNAIKTRANENVQSAEVGSGLIAQIQDGWTLSGSGGKYVMSNVADKAVYIEFGVGVTGGEDPHPQAHSASYHYNMPGKKLKDNSWIFRVGDINLVDIGEGYVMERPNGEKFYETDKTIRTKGQPAKMYLYNAVMSFVESDEPQKIWSKISLKYFG